jgi:hypothetical protein
MSNDQPLSRRHVLQMTGAGSLGLLLGAAGAEADDAEKRPPWARSASRPAISPWSPIATCA